MAFFQVEYRKKYEQSKGHYHTALDTAEQLHHKENAVLHSQVSSSHPTGRDSVRKRSICPNEQERTINNKNVLYTYHSALVMPVCSRFTEDCIGAQSANI